MAGKAINERILALLGDNRQILAGYLAIREEVDVLQAMTVHYDVYHQLCLPVVINPAEPLVFRHWQPGQPLKKGAYNVQVPPASEPLLTPDAVLVPLLAFDARGHRLGYGAGYYDRTIKQLRDTKKRIQIIGVAYSMQQLAQLPVDEHDQKLDVIITENEIIRPL